MRLTLLVAIVCGAMNLVWAAPVGAYQQGTVVRMHMGDCGLMHRGFMAQFGPPQAVASEEACPEYTLVTDKVVFLIVGKSSNQLVPLAEVIDFRLENRELAVRVDDARKEAKFAIKEMTLRSEWELIQKHMQQELSQPSQQPVDALLRLRSRQ
jgi:hypothetical protein